MFMLYVRLLLFRLTLTELGDMALRGKPLRMAESRNWIELLTTSLAVFVHVYLCVCECVCVSV